MSDFRVQPVTQAIFVTTLQVRIYDINYGNHLGNDALISLLHEARAQFFKSRGFTEINVDGLGILVTNLVVNYLGQAYYADQLKVEMAVGDISKTSAELIYQLETEENGRKIARGLTTITFYDYEKKKVSRIPQVFLDSLQIKES